MPFPDTTTNGRNPPADYRLPRLFSQFRLEIFRLALQEFELLKPFARSLDREVSRRHSQSERFEISAERIFGIASLLIADLPFNNCPQVALEVVVSDGIVISQISLQLPAVLPQLIESFIDRTSGDLPILSVHAPFYPLRTYPQSGNGFATSHGFSSIRGILVCSLTKNLLASFKQLFETFVYHWKTAGDGNLEFKTKGNARAHSRCG